jgi:branched-chain amino acid transport system permease protein
MGFGSLVLLLLLIFPYFGGSYYSHIFIIVFLNVILASGYRLLYITALGSFCHVIFYGIGAYTSALLALKFGLPYGLCFLASGLTAALVAVLFTWPAVRAKGVYFFIISFAFWVVMHSVFKHWKGLTNGSAGLRGIPPIGEFTGVIPYYYMALILCLFTVIIMYRIDKSRFGQELMAIGEDDVLAGATGINVVRHRVLAHTIGALFAGFAGSLFAHYARYIAPKSFNLWFTVYILFWCVLGGEKKFWGPIAGAVLLTLIAELLRMTGVLQAIFYAVAVLVVVMTMPHGIAGLVENLRNKYGRKADHLGRPEMKRGLAGKENYQENYE